MLLLDLNEFGLLFILDLILIYIFWGKDYWYNKIFLKLTDVAVGTEKVPSDYSFLAGKTFWIFIQSLHLKVTMFLSFNVLIIQLFDCLGLLCFKSQITSLPPWFNLLKLEDLCINSLTTYGIAQYENIMQEFKMIIITEN